LRNSEAAKRYETIVVPQDKAREKKIGELTSIWTRQATEKLNKKEADKIEAK